MTSFSSIKGTLLWLTRDKKQHTCYKLFLTFSSDDMIALVINPKETFGCWYYS